MKRIRQTEIAQRAGVSIATVSRVINQSGYVAEDVRKRVEEAIADLGYLPTGRFYAQRKRIVGVIVPNSTVAPYFERLSQCIQRECESMGYAAIFTHDDKLDNESLRNHASMLSRLGFAESSSVVFVMTDWSRKQEKNLASAVFRLLLLKEPPAAKASIVFLWTISLAPIRLRSI